MLAAEPDEHIAASLLADAAARGIATTWCRDGVATLGSFITTQPDVLVIAAQIPVIAVGTIVEILRWRWALPILVGCGAGDGGCAQRALTAGATAILARPYHIDSIYAFTVGEVGEKRPRGGCNKLLVAGPIIVDQKRHEASVDGREIYLTRRELDLLSYLIRLRGSVATHADIVSSVWGHPTDTNTVAVHIKRLRDKLGEHPQYGQLIRTVRGVGYRLTPTAGAPTADLPRAPHPQRAEHSGRHLTSRDTDLDRNSERMRLGQTTHAPPAQPR